MEPLGKCRQATSLFLCHVNLLADTGFLTGEITEVEDAAAADLAELVNLDTVNERRLEGENSFNADTTGNLADREGLGERIGTFHLNNYSAELLESFLITFLDSVGNGDGVTGLEFRIGSNFLILESLLCYFNQIHNFL